MSRLPPGGTGIIPTLKIGETVDLGIYTYEEEAPWQHALGVLAAIDQQSAGMRPFKFEPGSRVDELRGVFPDPPVDLRATVIRGLDTSLDSVQQLARYVTGNAHTTPILIGTMMRSLLLSSSRVVFLLGPTDPEVRRAHALNVLGQECASLKRHLRVAKNLEQMAGLRPPAEILHEKTDSIKKVEAVAGRFTESAMLESMVASVGELLDDSPYGEEATSELRGAFKETIMLAFQNYSGIAHGYAWPCTIPRTNSNLPNQFHTDLLTVASICQIGLQLFAEQS